MPEQQMLKFMLHRQVASQDFLLPEVRLLGTTFSKEMVAQSQSPLSRWPHR